MDSVLRPRDIQARIRAGESAEEVAAAAQTTVDKIMAFAAPVLAERSHITSVAQRSSVRGGDRDPAGRTASRTLGECVEARLRSRNVDPDTVTWDAWRRPDGKWTLVADYVDGPGGRARRGEFTYDAPGRYVTAQDDDARWLIGGDPAPIDPAALVSPMSAVDIDQLSLGDDAIALVTGPAVSRPAAADDADEADEEETTDLGDAAARLRAAPPAVPDETPAAEPAPASAQDVLFDSPEPTTADSSETASADDAGDASDTGDEAAAARRSPRRGRRKGRASVPSWDEIMFGNSQD